jgi:hypothetical protein
MEAAGERRIRPALWVILGALAVAVGLLMALDAAATALLWRRSRRRQAARA